MLEGKYIVNQDSYVCHDIKIYSTKLGEILLDGFNSFSLSRGGETVDKLEHLHKLAGISKNLEDYRQCAFKIFESPEFQGEYRALGLHLIEKLCAGFGFLQRKPVIRIQLPYMPSTSFHCDAWYGHSESALSVWLPLVDADTASCFKIVNSLQSSDKLKRTILDNSLELDQINDLCIPYCISTGIGKGGCAVFSSTTIHGAVKNESNKTRVSFDFRISPTEDTGTKPISNFYPVKNSALEVNTFREKSNNQRLKAITYSNHCRRVAAKSQLMLCAAFADSMDIDVILNESEIYEFSHLPVLRKYLNTDLVDAVVVFGFDIFEGDVALGKSILELAILNKKTLVFCAEAFVFSHQEQLDTAHTFLKK